MTAEMQIKTSIVTCKNVKVSDPFYYMHFDGGDSCLWRIYGKATSTETVELKVYQTGRSGIDFTVEVSVKPTNQVDFTEYLLRECELVDYQEGLDILRETLKSTLELGI